MPPAQAPKPDAAALFFPRHRGDSWEMKETVDGHAHRVTFTARGAASDDAAGPFYIDMMRDGQLVQSEGYRQDEHGVYRVAAGPGAAGKIEPPMPMLRLPFKAPSAWRWRGALKDADGETPAEATFKLTGPELLNTPSGSFQAYRLEQTFILRPPEGLQTVRNEQWLAPGVGLVKQVTDDGVQKTVAELTKHNVGQP
jgi:hypothetical protein